MSYRDQQLHNLIDQHRLAGSKNLIAVNFHDAKFSTLSPYISA